jgi:D-3-phosphoglycerate dehydrogenase
MAYTVFVPDRIHAAGPDLLRARGAAVISHEAFQNATPKALIARCDAAIVATFYLDEALLRAAPRLKLIVKHGVGIDNVVDPALAGALGIQVANTPGANSVSVAEHILLLMLALARGLVRCAEAARTRERVDCAEFVGSEMAGKTLGIIGLGNIGLTLARMARFGLDMRVVGCDRDGGRRREYPEYVEVLPDARRVLAAADYVCLCLPLTPETAGFVNREALRAMKPTACLINAARGGIVDEAALYEALREGRIAGAALDVLQDERNWRGARFMGLPNALITPHIAAMTEEACRRMSLAAAEQVCIQMPPQTGRGRP